MKTFKEVLQENIAKAQKQVEANTQVRLMTLAKDPTFIESQRTLGAKTTELTKLNAIITSLNAIKPFIASDGRKFNINCFPVTALPAGVAQVVGIIQASRGAFTDEMALQYQAITGVPPLTFASATVALGNPSYLDKTANKATEEIPANWATLVPELQAIYLNLDLQEFQASDLSEAQLNLWFATSKLKAITQEKEVAKAADLDTGEFLIED